MRIFKDFKEAEGEIKRDLKEMGIRVEATRMQDKTGEFPTLELINYGYTVLEPAISDLSPSMPWAEVEWGERRRGAEGNPVNPGKSWTHREKIWEEFLELNCQPRPVGDYLSYHEHDHVSMAYTYPERFATDLQVRRVIHELKVRPASHQLYIAMWDPNKDIHRIGDRRVPCSLGWHLMFRENALHMTYTMRSCDFMTHWHNDCWLAIRLLEYIASEANVGLGSFCHFINSFHIYERDVAGVF